MRQEKLIKIMRKSDSSKEISKEIPILHAIRLSFPSMSIFSIHSLVAKGSQFIEVIVGLNFCLTLAYF